MAKQITWTRRGQYGIQEEILNRRPINPFLTAQKNRLLRPSHKPFYSAIFPGLAKTQSPKEVKTYDYEHPSSHCERSEAANPQATTTHGHSVFARPASKNFVP